MVHVELKDSPVPLDCRGLLAPQDSTACRDPKVQRLACAHFTATPLHPLTCKYNIVTPQFCAGRERSPRLSGVSWSSWSCCECLELGGGHFSYCLVFTIIIQGPKGITGDPGSRGEVGVKGDIGRPGKGGYPGEIGLKVFIIVVHMIGSVWRRGIPIYFLALFINGLLITNCVLI